MNTTPDTTRTHAEGLAENINEFGGQKQPMKTPCSLFSIDQHFRRLMLYPPELRATVSYNNL
jgi:hypothetical protein